MRESKAGPALRARDEVIALHEATEREHVGTAHVHAVCFERAFFDPRSRPDSRFCVKKQAPKIRGLENGAACLRRQGVP